MRIDFQLQESRHMETTRATLLAKVYERKPIAQAEFYLIYHPIAIRYAQHYVRGEDAVRIGHDVTVKFAVEKPIQYDPKRGKFRHLLMVAVRCRWLDLVREKKRDRHIPYSDSLDGVQEYVPDITKEEMLRAEQLQEVMEAIRGDFKPHTWEAFVCRMEGQPSVAVAEKLGMKPNAVDAAYDRVKKRLKEEYERRGIAPDGIE